jgi:hypothetical protein
VEWHDPRAGVQRVVKMAKLMRVFWRRETASIRWYMLVDVASVPAPDLNATHKVYMDIAFQFVVSARRQLICCGDLAEP